MLLLYMYFLFTHLSLSKFSYFFIYTFLCYLFNISKHQKLSGSDLVILNCYNRFFSYTQNIYLRVRRIKQNLSVLQTEIIFQALDEKEYLFNNKSAIIIYYKTIGGWIWAFDNIISINTIISHRKLFSWNLGTIFLLSLTYNYKENHKLV